MLLALDAFNTHGSTRPDVGLQQAINVVMQRRETPATDAFLAEVRAQGVDSAVETIIVHMNHQHVAVAGALHILRTRAAQIRKEAAQ